MSEGDCETYLTAQVDNWVRFEVGMVSSAATSMMQEEITSVGIHEDFMVARGCCFYKYTEENTIKEELNPPVKGFG